MFRDRLRWPGGYVYIWTCAGTCTCTMKCDRSSGGGSFMQDSNSWCIVSIWRQKLEPFYCWLHDRSVSPWTESCLSHGRLYRGREKSSGDSQELASFWKLTEWSIQRNRHYYFNEKSIHDLDKLLGSSESVRMSHGEWCKQVYSGFSLRRWFWEKPELPTICTESYRLES